jgi:hypothetical protein
LDARGKRMRLIGLIFQDIILIVLAVMLGSVMTLTQAIGMFSFGTGIWLWLILVRYRVWNCVGWTGMVQTKRVQVSRQNIDDHGGRGIDEPIVVYETACFAEMKIAYTRLTCEAI